MTPRTIARNLTADVLTAFADWCARVDAKYADAINEGEEES